MRAATSTGRTVMQSVDNSAQTQHCGWAVALLEAGNQTKTLASRLLKWPTLAIATLASPNLHSPGQSAPECGGKGTNTVNRWRL